MSIAKPPVDSRVSEQSADDVDGLLREFFKAALPKAWPPFQRPARAVLPFAAAPSWGRRFRSSLALAASLILLALGLGVLSGKFSMPSRQETPGGQPSAVRPDDGLHHGHPRPEKN